MNILLLGNPDGWYVSELKRAAIEAGHHAVCWDFTRLTAAVLGRGDELSQGDSRFASFGAVIVRTMPPGSLEQVVFRMNLLGRMEAAGIPVLNSPKAIECAVDKYLTTARLAEAGLPVPETVVCETADEAEAARVRLGGDVVVKPLFGSEGRGIVRVSDPDIGCRVFRAIERIGGVLYVQRFIQHDGSDLRILVLDGQVIGAMKRCCDTDFRTNVALDGRAEPHTPTAQERELALRAAAATGARFAGVDLMYGPSGEVFVIEVNAVPGWKALQSVTGIDVAARVIRAVAGVTKKPLLARFEPC